MLDCSLSIRTVVAVPKPGDHPRPRRRSASPASTPRLGACSGIATGPPLRLLDRGRGWQQGGFLVTEPPGQRFLQSGQRLAQSATAVVLEDHTAVVQRTGHEPGSLPPPDLDPAALPN